MDLTDLSFISNKLSARGSLTKPISPIAFPFFRDRARERKYQSTHVDPSYRSFVPIVVVEHGQVGWNTL